MTDSQPNPYAMLGSEASVAAAEPLAMGYVYRPTHLLTPMLRVAYGIQIALLAVWIPLGIFAARVFADDEFDMIETSGTNLAVVMSVFLLAVLYLAVLLATIVLHCIWTNRSNKNARALGAEGMEFSPGWAVGWFFIPIANLWKPLQAANEFYRASIPGPSGTEWQEQDMPEILKAWWACWIIGSILSRVADRAPLDPTVAVVVDSMSSIIWIFAAALAFRWINTVYRRQEQTASELETHRLSRGEPYSAH